MSAFIWLHEEALRATHPLFLAPVSPEKSVFIWDDAYMDAMEYGLKRRVFLYETLLDLPVEIYAGDTLETLKKLAEATGASHIRTAATPNPQLSHIMDALATTVKLERVADEAFVNLPEQDNLRRFFKYWNKAKKLAFQPDGGR
tara:strand:+ start:853 stop:1284 length:432 start_codon:yes stop_codon:yes gene_type:complete